MNTSPNYDEIKKRVKEIVQQITNLDDSSLGDETHFVDELKLDSLVLLEIAVTVDKEYRLVGKREGVGCKSILFVLKSHNVRMSHGAGYGYAITLSGQNIAGSGKSSDIATPSNFHTSILALGTAKRKIDDRPSLGSVDAACGL